LLPLALSVSVAVLITDDVKAPVMVLALTWRAVWDELASLAVEVAVWFVLWVTMWLVPLSVAEVVEAPVIRLALLVEEPL
jgi:hypothetical protein